MLKRKEMDEDEKIRKQREKGQVGGRLCGLGRKGDMINEL